MPEGMLARDVGVGGGECRGGHREQKSAGSTIVAVRSMAPRKGMAVVKKG